VKVAKNGTTESDDRQDYLKTDSCRYYQRTQMSSYKC